MQNVEGTLTKAEIERALIEGRADVNADGELYETSSWQAIDLGPIKAGEVRIAPPEFLPRSDGELLIYPGRAHSFFGPSESLKSWAALVACRSVLDAGKTALYLDFEDEAVSFVERTRAIGIADDDLGTRLKYVRPDEPLHEDKPPDWDLSSLTRSLRPALVVIDGVSEAYTLHGWDVLSTTDAVKYQHLLLRGFEEGVATLEIDHTAKNLKGTMTQFGAQQKRAGIDGASYEFQVKLAGGRGGVSTAEIIVSKDRHGYVRRFAHEGKRVGTFRLQPTEDGKIDASIEPPDPRTVEDRADALRDRVGEFVGQNPRSSTTAIRKAMRGHGRDAIDEALGRLVESGDVVVEEGARRSKLYSLAPLGGGGG